jgi:hypothetical protein
VSQPAGDEDVSPVKSEELDQPVAPAQVASCGEDERRLGLILLINTWVSRVTSR